MADTFRKEYKKLKDENSKKIIIMKEACEKVEEILRTVQSREM